jgi:hypothetical protein
MLPKSRFLFKGTVFLKVAAFLVIITTIVILTFTQKQPVADAQIASLYASTCLGGWKDVDKVTGVPEVAGDATVEYSESNSATLYNKQTQIYCGGFTGQIPNGVNRTKVALRFSWGIEGEARESKKDESSNDNPSVPESPGLETGTTSSPDSSLEVPPEEQTPAESPESEELPSNEESLEEPAPEETTVSWWRSIVPLAFAQEEVIESEIIEEPIEENTQEEVVPVVFEPEPESEVIVTTSLDTEPTASSSEIATSSPATDTASSTATTTPRSYLSTIFDENTDKDNAIFEVLFTMDNEEWYPLGYVSRINNDIQFELPLELFTTVEDFNKLQISLKTVERFDETPKIYLDSMWLEVAYLDAGEDPLPPPGTKEGDIIMSSISTQETSLVTVFRGVGLETVSNILSSQGSSTATTTATTTASSSEGQGTTTAAIINNATSSLAYSSATATSTASTSVPLVTFESDIPYEVRKNLRATPGVEVEVWLYNRLTDAWTRVADNSTAATMPRAVLIEGKVFWFGYENSSLWMFDTQAKSYNSRSLSVTEPVEIEFISSSGESTSVWFNNESELLEVKNSTSTEPSI